MIGPVVWLFTKTGSDRIHADVVCFLRRGLVPAKAMVEEIPLPTDTLGFRQPAFEGGDGLFHRFFPGEFKQAVKVIRHREKKRASQVMIGLADPDRLDDPLPNFHDSQLIGAPGHGVDCDEKDIAFRIRYDERRNIVRQDFATDGIHDFKVGRTRLDPP